MDKLGIKKVIAVGLALLLVVWLSFVWFDGKNAVTRPAPTIDIASTTGDNQAAISLALVPASAPAILTIPDIAPTLSVEPENIEQGDPIMVRINGTTTVKNITFAGVALPVVNFQSMPTAFIGIDLNKKPGKYLLAATLLNGNVLEKEITVTARQEIVVPLGIPAALGGNTPAAATNLTDALTVDNKVLASLVSAPAPLWSEPFRFPVADPVVTDPYGYSRQTEQYQIPHKGVDFKAPPGTPVMAINDGKVIYAKDLGVYGNTIIVDHGLGIMSFYMHLSAIDVTVGEKVRRGELIGFSGETGYAEGPHLHLTVRVGGISIDPMVFFAFFQ